MHWSPRRGIAVSFIALIVLSAMVIGVGASAHNTGPVATYELFAGQDQLVGNVTVEENGSYLDVTYTLATGFAMTESHLSVVDESDDFPMTRKGNPKVGQFEYSSDHDPAVTTYTYTVSPPGNDGNLSIAAHAVVVETSTTDVVSDTSWQVTAFNGASVSPYNAVEAWDHPAWTNVDHTFSTDAEWIWSSYRSNDTVNGDYVDFEKVITIDGTPTDGHVYVTADNGYEMWVNGHYVGNSSILGDYTVDRTLGTNISNYGWQTVEHYDISSYLVEGENTIKITGVNAALEGGTVDSNPAGVIVEGEISSVNSETAWADGERFTDRGSWATWFEFVLSSD